MPIQVDEQSAVEATKLIAHGEIIMAVKLVRERTGCGLAEAKEWVDQHRTLASATQPALSPDEKLQAALPAIDRELLADRVIMAIKLHRESTGLGLKESKDFCDARRAQLLAGKVAAPASQPAATQPAAPTSKPAQTISAEERKRLDDEQAARFDGKKKAGCLGVIALIATSYFTWRWL